MILMDPIGPPRLPRFIGKHETSDPAAAEVYVHRSAPENDSSGAARLILLMLSYQEYSWE
jgi:hypothetical protein